MEFLQTTVIPATDSELKKRLMISTLPHWCTSIYKVLADYKTNGEINCVWGVFEIQREELLHGVRFTLPGCPYAMQWAVTTGHGPNPQHTVIHLTTNRTEHEAEFADTIRQFMLDWKNGLESHW